VADDPPPHPSPMQGRLIFPSIFRFVTGNSTWDNLNKIAMAGFGMSATERDPDYAGTVTSILGPKQKIILMCAIGGSLVSKLYLRPDKYPDGIEDPDRNFGRESRSLKAAFELMRAGWTSSNLLYVDGECASSKHDCGYICWEWIDNEPVVPPSSDQCNISLGSDGLTGAQEAGYIPYSYPSSPLFVSILVVPTGGFQQWKYQDLPVERGE